MSLSVGVMVFLGVYLVIKRASSIRIEKPDFSSFTKFAARVAEETTSHEKDRVYLIGSGIGILTAILISSGKCGIKGIVLGMGAGLVLSWLYLFMRRYAVKARKMRETAVLYLMVDMHLRSGYTMSQSLRGAMAMTPGLARQINKCLEMWPDGPVQALEYLRKSINLNEADTLISVLIHAMDLGSSSLGGAMEEGSRQLQNLQRALVRTQAAGRPVAFSFFRLLPLLGCLGIVVGPLLVQLTKAMTQILNIF